MGSPGGVAGSAGSSSRGGSVTVEPSSCTGWAGGGCSTAGAGAGAGATGIAGSTAAGSGAGAGAGAAARWAARRRRLAGWAGGAFGAGDGAAATWAGGATWRSLTCFTSTAPAVTITRGGHAGGGLGGERRDAGRDGAARR